jgi:hypothetical protein
MLCVPSGGSTPTPRIIFDGSMRELCGIHPSVNSDYPADSRRNPLAKIFARAYRRDCSFGSDQQGHMREDCRRRGVDSLAADTAPSPVSQRRSPACAAWPVSLTEFKAGFTWTTSAAPARAASSQSDRCRNPRAGRAQEGVHTPLPIAGRAAWQSSGHGRQFVIVPVRDGPAAVE